MLFSPQIFFRYIDMCMKDTDLLIKNNVQPILDFQKKTGAATQMWNPPPLTCRCWGQQQVSRDFLVIFFHSLFFVWFIRNHDESRTEGLTLCRQKKKEEAKELFKKEGLRAASMTYILQKNIIFLKTNKKEMKESILSWSCSESILSWFDRDRASIFIILKMPRNGVTIHARRYTSSGILTRKTAGPAGARRPFQILEQQN